MRRWRGWSGPRWTAGPREHAADGGYRFEYNPRLLSAARTLVRGTIYDRHKLPLATSRPDEIAAEIDPDYDHASWSENFPWTRLPDVKMPAERKPALSERPRGLGRPAAWREALGDGSFGGPYQLLDEDVLRLWAVAVEELRSQLVSGWPS